MTKILKITLESNALITNGDGEGLIDIDTISDEFGRFYIPAKRLKGVLRESATEILEMQNFNDDEVAKKVDKIFGTAHENGTISVQDALLKDAEFYKALSLDFSKNSVLNLNSIVLNQTSIDKNGVAKNGSLRRKRVAKKGLVFEANFSYDKKDERLIKNSVKNLKRIGLARNRGLGEIRCEILESGAQNISQNGAKNSKILQEISEFSSKIDENSIILKLTSPVALTHKKGDDFNIATLSFIPATTLKGAILAKIKDENLKRDFEKVTLKNGYFYEDGKIYSHAPNSLKKQKYSDNAQIYDDFFYKKQTDIKTCSIGEFATINGTEISVKSPLKESFFHTKRVRQTQNSSVIDDARKNAQGEIFDENAQNGAIFVYEALCKDQIFVAKIVCDENLLKRLKNELCGDGGIFNLKLGRSKSAGYSNTIATIKIAPKKSLKMLAKQFYIVAQSPIILYDENGVFSPNAKTLKDYLENLTHAKLQISLNAKFSRQKFYKLSYKCKVAETFGFAAGSVFKIVCDKEIDTEIFKNGIGELKEFGYGQVEIYENFSDLKISDKTAKKAENSQNSQTFENAKILHDGAQKTVQISGFDYEKISPNQKEKVFEILSEILYKDMVLDKSFENPIGYYKINENSNKDDNDQEDKLTTSEYSRLESIVNRAQNFNEIEFELDTKNNPTAFNQKMADKGVKAKNLEIEIPSSKYPLFDEFVKSNKSFELQKRVLIAKIRYLRHKKEA
ncbi:MAG: RAMP superfamily CRISPR-associated protein [Campylobacter sp.]|nr:RAMP superfamily CRISPR-associated protein [Campylobacter sp.]